MEDQDALEKEVRFLKLRLEQAKRENELVKKENKSLKEEMSTLKDTVKKIVVSRPRTAIDNKPPQENEQQLRYVLEYQRGKMEDLEKEVESYKWKYEQLVEVHQKGGGKAISFAKNGADGNNNSSESTLKPESVRLADMFAGSSEILNQLQKENDSLKDKVKSITSMYAQETAQLKSTLAKQDALLLSSHSSSTNAIANTSSLNRSKISLDPIDQSQSKSSSVSNSAVVLGARQSYIRENKQLQDSEPSIFSYSTKKKKQM